MRGRGECSSNFNFVFTLGYIELGRAQAQCESPGMGS